MRQRRLRTTQVGLKKSSGFADRPLSVAPAARDTACGMKNLLAPRAPSPRRVATAAILPPAAAVVLALAFGAGHLATATAVCLLAVVGAGAIGGLRGGIAAAILSFLCLNFFFTEPRHTLMVREPSDVIALSAFLLAALIVGTLLTRAIDEQARAERRAT